MLEFDGEQQAMCCHGCKAAASTIINSGMASFYRYRTETPDRAREIVPEFLQQLSGYDHPQVQKQFIRQSGETTETGLILEGIACAACVWLNEQYLSKLDGVVEVNINYSTHRAQVKWDNSQIKLSDILEAVTRIGYTAHPYDPDKHQRILEKERKQQLKRIGLAGVLGMQIMILAVAMYTGEWWGIETNYDQFFRWTSLLLCTPLLLYSSRPFFETAWRDLSNKRVGMDVPVALGMGIAFTASVLHTINGTGDIYYDSVAMFTLFLLSARYFETTARKRTSESTESLLRLTPALATKVINKGDIAEYHTCPVAELSPGDLVLVKPGENIPVDGIVTQGESGVNESLITGESLPVTRTSGSEVIGGSTNIENPLIIRVEKIGDETVLSRIHQLLINAQSSKPAIASLADRVASWFVFVILCIATGVAIYWLNHNPDEWLAITIATLVVTCPCALSLATPAALTAATGQLAHLGFIPVKPDALETLAKVDTFMFDKTGTLSEGKLQIAQITLFSNLDQHSCLQIAASLEQSSSHPVAQCVVSFFKGDLVSVSSQKHKTGFGVSGQINNQQWFLGNADYIAENCKSDHLATILKNNNSDFLTQLYLANEHEVVTLINMDDTIREHTGDLIRKLRRMGKRIILATGDQTLTAQRLADALGIREVHANMKPEDKLALLQSCQQAGEKVAMLGDGINDAPVLAAADVSIAMGNSSQLAAAQADMVLLSNDVTHIYTGHQVAIKTMRIIKQNLFWAIGYNLTAVPAAALGLVQPWLAAIGMSASSIIVVLNALRLNKSNSSASTSKNR